MFAIAVMSLSRLVFSDLHCKFFNCAHWTHEGGQVMCKAMPYFVFTEAMVSCFIHGENFSHVWNPCFLFHFAVSWARVEMGHVCPSYMRNPMMLLCHI